MPDDSEDPDQTTPFSLNGHLDELEETGDPSGDDVPEMVPVEYYREMVPVEYYREMVVDCGRLQREKRELENQIAELQAKNQQLQSEQPPDGPVPEEYEPFPVEALPETPRAYVEAASAAVDVHPAFVAVPMLSVLSAAVGASACLQLKHNWREPATLWTAVVAPSGSSKSPALRHVLRPVYRHEREARERYEAAMERYDPESDEPRPVRTRYRTGDPTPEAVVQILEENPRGLLLSRDELAAWIGSFDRYASGAADLQFWIELWNGVQVSRDRVGDGNVTVDRPAVPLTGTIQPETLKEKIGELHFQSGFASRLILCRPPVKPKTWTEAEVTEEVLGRYGQLLQTLYALEDRMEEGRPAPVALSTDAKEKWIRFFNEQNERLHAEPNGVSRAARAKTINHAARLALIFHLCRVAQGEREPGPVDRGTLDRALAAARWCLMETLRVYRVLDLGTAAQEPPERFLRRLPTPFTTADAKEAAAAADITERTMFRWLDSLQEEGKIDKTARGHYRKRE